MVTWNWKTVTLIYYNSWAYVSSSVVWAKKSYPDGILLCNYNVPRCVLRLCTDQTFPQICEWRRVWAVTQFSSCHVHDRTLKWRGWPLLYLWPKHPWIWNRQCQGTGGTWVLVDVDGRTSDWRYRPKRSSRTSGLQHQSRQQYHQHKQQKLKGNSSWIQKCGVPE